MRCSGSTGSLQRSFGLPQHAFQATILLLFMLRRAYFGAAAALCIQGKPRVLSGQRMLMRHPLQAIPCGLRDRHVGARQASWHAQALRQP